MKYLTILFFLAFLSSAGAQNRQVREALRKIEIGDLNAANGILAELEEAGKEDPAIYFLSAALNKNASQSAFIYRKIVTDYPKSEWADDSYWRLVQFYAVKGDTTKATDELNAFKQKLPNSEYITPAMDLVATAKKFQQSKSPKHDNIKAKPDKISSEQKTAITGFNNKDKAERDKILSNSKKEKWGLQVGIFKTVEAAQQEAENFTKLRLKNKIVEKDIKGVKMFAVIVGSYSSREIAEQNRSLVENSCECETILHQLK